MNNMCYWIQYDPNTNQLTKITQQNEFNQNDWHLVMVSNDYQDYFTNHYQNVKYNPKSQALIYPSDFSIEQQLTNNNNYALNSLEDTYKQGLANITANDNSLTNQVSSISNAINTTKQDIASQMSDLRNIASINKNENYLTQDQQEYIENYIMANTPLNYSNIFNHLPTLNIPMSLSITIDSPNWKYIAPQLNNKKDVTIQDNQIIFKGNNVNQLKQVLNVEFAKDSSSVWAILHYGNKITIKNIGLYY